MIILSKGDGFVVCTGQDETRLLQEIAKGFAGGSAQIESVGSIKGGVVKKQRYWSRRPKLAVETTKRGTPVKLSKNGKRLGRPPNT